MYLHRFPTEQLRLFNWARVAILSDQDVTLSKRLSQELSIQQRYHCYHYRLEKGDMGCFKSNTYSNEAHRASEETVSL